LKMLFAKGTPVSATYKFCHKFIFQIMSIELVHNLLSVPHMTWFLIPSQEC
jgi:antibiotic biosynthesis monooxygenase (ABM) superfamily enzyme